MTKPEQAKLTEQAQAQFTMAIKQLPKVAFSHMNKKQMKQAGAEQLRHCTAWVWETLDYYVLQSYETFVACIEKATDTCYDVLRVEYGYTSTSAQHIAKFRHDYGSGKWGCAISITAR